MVPPQFVEEIILPPLNCFPTFVKYQLAILAWGYFLFFYFSTDLCLSLWQYYTILIFVAM